MMFLLFQLGTDRYVLEAARVVEVLPLVEVRKIPGSRDGIAGIFDYHGEPVPAVDLAAIATGVPARDLLSTRLVLVNHPDEHGHPRFLGLIVEHATQLIRRDAAEFVEPALKLGGIPRLGPVLMDGQGMIQWVHEDRLVPESVRASLFLEPAGRQS